MLEARDREASSTSPGLSSDHDTEDEGEESGEDKENEAAAPAPAYLKYEDFSHTPLGLETYTDGLRHPVEMRRLLTGDLASEVSVSYKESPEETFRNLSYPRANKRPVSDVFESPSLSVFSSSSSLLPKPPKLFKGNSLTSFPQKSALTSSWREEQTSSVSSDLSDFRGHSSFMPAASPRKPGRPPTSLGASFDPETGSVRYSCRLHCGASLASAKGRRKHEKKHCPNFGKVAPPILKGQRSRLLKQQLEAGMAANANGQNSLGFAHSLFGAFAGQQQVRERRIYECRYCGKVLKTYEGRRLHEKLQHVAKQQQQQERLSEAQQEEEISTEDNKQLLIEHLKAAGMDPSCLDDDPGKILNQNGELGEPIIEYGDEDDDDDDEEDDYGEEPSSDGLLDMPLQ